MKKLLFTILILTPFIGLAQDGQTMAYKFGYLFKQKRMLNGQGKLFLVKPLKKKTTQTVGYFGNAPVTVIKKDVIITSDTLIERSFLKQLRGIVSSQSANGDTLFIKFWKFKKDNLKGDRLFVNSDDEDAGFAYVIDSLQGWKQGWLHAGKTFDVPFRYRQFLATNIPFRILQKSGKLESDFLNANIAFMSVSGATRVYKSDFLSARNRYFAYGPYVGLSAIDNPLTTRKEFGLNYGLSGMIGIQGFNIICAYGFQNGFNEGTKGIQPYIGLGIGFKLMDTFAPDIKRKEN
jgi:hypothetical protein